jgi:Spy/CpxP family protein refolding chaperone
MHILKATALLGALLTTGMLAAQAPANPSQDTQLSAQNPPAQHEGRGHHNMNPDKQAEHLAKKLNLTKDQEQQIKPILEDRKQKVESLRADSTLAPKDRHEKMRAIQQDSKNKIEAVLNDSQKQQFEQMMAARHDHNKGMAAPPAQPTQPNL